VIKMPIWN